MGSIREHDFKRMEETYFVGFIPVDYESEYFKCKKCKITVKKPHLYRGGCKY